MKKTICSKCNYSFSNKGGCYNRHYVSCNGGYKPPTKLLCCKYCEMTFSNLTTSQRANHSRWCTKNPKRDSYNIFLAKVRTVRKNFRNQYTKARQEGREVPVSPNKGKRGSFTGKTHSAETKQRMRDKALASSHRRLKKNATIYKGILLDSSWELELAKRLDELAIEWVRPEPIKWLDQNGNFHNYFPDFYLPLYNLYLDPKNPHAVKVQQNKLKLLLKQHPNIRILTTLEECKKFRDYENN